MTEIVIVIISILIIGFLIWIWGDVKIKYYQPHIFFVPNKKEFILSQGNYKIIFDTLTHVEARGIYSDVNDLYISKYSIIETRYVDDYLALDRNGKLVAIVPYRQIYSNKLPLYMPGSDKPEWLSVADFEEKQHDIIKSNHKN